MTDGSPITEELRNCVNKEQELGVYEVEKGMIQRFARAIGDDNPMWQDDKYERKSKFEGITAPPTFIITIGGEQFGEIMDRSFCDGLLHGATELECYQPVRPGDRIAVMARVANIRERQGSRGGRMAFVTFDISYTNQRRELVAKCQQTMVAYETGEGKHD